MRVGQGDLPVEQGHGERSLGQPLPIGRAGEPDDLHRIVFARFGQPFLEDQRCLLLAPIARFVWDLEPEPGCRQQPIPGSRQRFGARFPIVGWDGRQIAVDTVICGEQRLVAPAVSVQRFLDELFSIEAVGERPAYVLIVEECGRNPRAVQLAAADEWVVVAADVEVEEKGLPLGPGKVGISAQRAVYILSRPAFSGRPGAHLADMGLGQQLHWRREFGTFHAAVA